MIPLSSGVADEIAQAEHRGLEHLLRVFSSGEDFDLLSRDDSDLDDEEIVHADAIQEPVLSPQVVSSTHFIPD